MCVCKRDWVSGFFSSIQLQLNKLMHHHNRYWICCMYASVVVDAGYMTRSLSNLMDSIRSVYYDHGHETISLSILEFGNQHFHNYQVDGRHEWTNYWWLWLFDGCLFVCHLYHRFMSVIYDLYRLTICTHIYLIKLVTCNYILYIPFTLHSISYRLRSS